jgi:crotonobetainyl-CoA:carnitine CoA-transferase CaiB-like acyl-CoA transferase
VTKQSTKPGTRTSRPVFTRALDDLDGATGRHTDRNIRFKARATSLGTPYHAAEAAAAALAAGADVVRAAAEQAGAGDGKVELDARHAESSLLSFAYLRFLDPERGLGARIAGEDRTAAAGFYPAKNDRWLYLHSGFPHNTQGLLDLLGVKDDRRAVARVIRKSHAEDLENHIAEAGLCGAMVRSPAQWDACRAGRLLASRPVVEIIQMDDSPPEPLRGPAERPLHGTRVLDLTRVLAGPTCARTLASYGADALRIGAEHLPSIPLFAVDTGLGKRAAALNLQDKKDAARLKRLVRQADVFSQGYRTGAMDRLGFGVQEVLKLRPGMVYVSINCYGHEGDWRSRPGWEQLAQTVTGMALRQGKHQQLAEPTLLPAAVNDYITGYLAALGALVALERRARVGGSYWVRVSLARTAMWVRSLGERAQVRAQSLQTQELAAFSANTDSAWGPLSYLQPAVSISNSTVAWDRPPSPLGSDRPKFLTG